MLKYYDILDIENDERSMFDTISLVSKLCKTSYNTIMNELGFERNIEIKNLMLNPPTNYFSIEHFLCLKLNSILRSRNIPVRIVGKRSRYLGWRCN